MFEGKIVARFSGSSVGGKDGTLLLSGFQRDGDTTQKNSWCSLDLNPLCSGRPSVSAKLLQKAHQVCPDFKGIILHRESLMVMLSLSPTCPQGLVWREGEPVGEADTLKV